MPPVSERLADGREVRTYSLGREGGLQVEVMDYGATVRRLAAPTRNGLVEVTPRYADLQDYVAGKGYLNAAIGRFANRLDHGRFTLDGDARQISINEPPNTLHGGKVGFDRRIWTLADHDPNTLRFTYRSPDGEEGFAGDLQAEAAYRVDGDSLTVTFSATADRPTPVNLTQHFYFNLSGRPDRTILDHQVRIAADAYTVVRKDLIPTGELRPVAGTPFDFRQARAVREAVEATGDEQIAFARGVDHNYVLTPGAGPQVSLHSPDTGLTLEILTDQPGMQVYTGQGMDPPFIPHGAIAFEPQGFPDGPNHPQFPSTILRPGQTYSHTSTYRFRS
jgi:aldose 1-epimerase